jgi:hypothetical protein
MRFVFLIIVFIFMPVVNLFGYKGEEGIKTKDIVSNIINNAKKNNTSIPNYEADFYVKGLIDVKKRNFTLKYIPYFNKIKRI